MGLVLWTQADAEQLKAAIMAAINNGTWQIQTMLFENQSITLRSLDDAQKLLKDMLAYLAAADPGVTRYVTTGKGV